MKRARDAAVLSLLLCMAAAALPALAKSPREIIDFERLTVVESDSARYEQTITRLEVRL